jgi:hypothetical protein
MLKADETFLAEIDGELNKRKVRQEKVKSERKEKKTIIKLVYPFLPPFQGHVKRPLFLFTSRDHKEPRR